jgi:N-acetylmuramic acid 6-phosphate etherase
MGEELQKLLASLSTEGSNPATGDLDRLSALDIACRLNTEDARVAGVVAGALPDIARVAEMAAASFRSGGRLIYLGAGTSGRLGVLDASECPPTFGVDPELVQGLIAGGLPALTRSQEGAEDSRQNGIADLDALDPIGLDTVVGISASHMTPWTVAGVERAVELGCSTAFVTCNSEVAVPGEVVVRLPVGPEAVTGSTRLKSGTAQKMCLNMISTTAMILIGKTFGNYMIDLDPLSEKLVERSRGLIMTLTRLDYREATALLESADGKVKLALLMHLGDLERPRAEARLEAADGHLRRALATDD